MTVSAITTLNPTPVQGVSLKLQTTTTIPKASSNITSRKAPTATPLPPHIKQMRFLLVFTLFFSAYAIYSSIVLTKLTFNFLPTAALGVWTLFMLFPLELDHHEGVAQSERHLLKWIVDHKIVLNAQRTSGAWAVSAVRTVFFALMGMSTEQKGVYAPNVWILAALEAASAGSLFYLASRWTEENWKHVQDKELEKKEAEREKKAGKASS